MDRRKLLLIFGGAWVSAALLTWFLWAATKAPRIEKTVKAVAAVRDMPAGTRLKKTDVKLVSIVERELPKTAVVDDKLAVDRILLVPVNANEVISAARLAGSGSAEGVASAIDPGKRAISVPFTDATGVAGLLQPRAHVDVLFTRSGSMAEAVTTTVLEDVTILAIGRNTEAAPAATTVAAGSNTTQRAATLLVTPEQAKKLEWAKNQGKISLALRNPLDHSLSENHQPTTALDMDLAGMVRGRRNQPNIANNRAWAQLTGQDDDVVPKKLVVEKKEPPKPHFVVDVYRGDKHVQEIFQ